VHSSNAHSSLKEVQRSPPWCAGALPSNTSHIKLEFNLAVTCHVHGAVSVLVFVWSTFVAPLCSLLPLYCLLRCFPCSGAEQTQAARACIVSLCNAS
jgi:hypothetical protein